MVTIKCFIKKTKTCLPNGKQVEFRLVKGCYIIIFRHVVKGLVQPLPQFAKHVMGISNPLI